MIGGEDVLIHLSQEDGSWGCLLHSWIGWHYRKEMIGQAENLVTPPSSILSSQKSHQTPRTKYSLCPPSIEGLSRKIAQEPLRELRLQITPTPSSILALKYSSNSFNVSTDHNDIVIVKAGADSKRAEILQWTSPLDPQLRHQCVRTKRLDGLGN